MDFVCFLESNIEQVYREYLKLSGDSVTKEGFIEYYKTCIASFDQKRNAPFMVNSIIEQLKSKIDELFI